MKSPKRREILFFVFFIKTVVKNCYEHLGTLHWSRFQKWPSEPNLVGGRQTTKSFCLRCQFNRKTRLPLKLSVLKIIRSTGL